MSGFQQPLFAPAQGGKSGEPDLDLNELFADYFVNEMEDPLRTFNHSVTAAMLPGDAVATQQQLQQTAMIAASAACASSWSRKGAGQLGSSARASARPPPARARAPPAARARAARASAA